MSNPYFNASGAPANRSAGASATIRAEFAAIAAGFELLSMGLNGIPVGATTPSTGAFTTLSASGATSLAALTASGLITANGGISGAHNGTVGASTPASGAFTTLNASGATTLAALTTTGNTILGDATTDTFNQGAGSLVKNAAGNWTIGVPAGGSALLLNQARGTLFPSESSQGIDWRLKTAAGGYGSFLTFDDTLGGFGIWSVGHIPGVNTFAIASGDPLTGATNRLTIGSAGNVTIAAPSSGDSLAISTLGGAFSLKGLLAAATTAASVSIGWDTPDALGRAAIQMVTTLNGAGSDSQLNFITNQFGVARKSQFSITNDGRLYGSALHNNAGAVTGTTNQYIASGTYTPTLTNGTNCSGLTASVCQWMRVGNVVTVSGSINLSPTTVSFTEFGVSLPIASNFTLIGQCAGVGARQDAGEIIPVNITADTTNDRAIMYFFARATTSADHPFTFTYVVL